jgi:Lon-like protease
MSDYINRGPHINKRTQYRRRPYLYSALLIVICATLLFFVPLPYYIFSPGTAEIIKPMVHVDAGNKEERGSFMLTTVSVSQTNAVTYLIALVHPYEDLYKKSDIFQKGESEQDYTERQQYVMTTSQSNAIQAAYKKAGVPFKIESTGVVVLGTVPGMPAEGVLASGDLLTQIDNTPLSKSEDLLQYMKSKKAGESVDITYRRGYTDKTVKLTLALLPKDVNAPANTEQRSGLGIKPADSQRVKADQANKQVTVQAGDIGGPSAGLMFSLEIYNQLMQGDITKGYAIAGTGTIDPEGVVGPIGGIEHKIIAADKAGAEIFFAPKDIVAGNGQAIRNYTTAVNRANEIHTKMKIVEVATMDDALHYLDTLPVKPSKTK